MSAHGVVALPDGRFIAKLQCGSLQQVSFLGHGSQIVTLSWSGSEAMIFGELAKTAKIVSRAFVLVQPEQLCPPVSLHR